MPKKKKTSQGSRKRAKLADEAVEAEGLRLEEEGCYAECARLDEEAKEAERLRLEEKGREQAELAAKCAKRQVEGYVPPEGYVLVKKPPSPSVLPPPKAPKHFVLTAGKTVGVKWKPAAVPAWAKPGVQLSDKTMLPEYEEG